MNRFKKRDLDIGRVKASLELEIDSIGFPTRSIVTQWGPEW